MMFTKNQIALMGVVLMTALCGQVAVAKGQDVNGDGVVSKDELLQSREKNLDRRFDKLDTNHDGVLTQDELAGKRGIAKKADANGDGVITREEARAHMRQNADKYMAKRDTNHDGKLEADERPKRASRGIKSVKKQHRVKKVDMVNTTGNPM